MKIAGAYQPKAVNLDNSAPEGVEVVRPVQIEATNSVATAKFDFRLTSRNKKLYQLVDACIEGTGIT
jgi:hypothetical protein